MTRPVRSVRRRKEGFMPQVIWLTGLLAASVTALAVFALRPQAGRLGLLDVAGGHKMHQGAVPVIGGIAMFFGLLAAVCVVPGAFGSVPAFMTGCAILVSMGAYDDAHGLSPKARLLGHVVVATLVFYLSPHGVRLETLGNFLCMGPVTLGPLALPVTVFVMVAAINAFNMMDGLDGLAGGIALATGVVLLVAVGTHVRPGLLPVLASLVGGTAAFLCFNAPTMLNRPVRTFMGDAGSTLIGFTLATVLVSACQGDQAAFAPINSVWFLFLPATEVIQSTLRRVLAGRSPFAPDRGHLHHQLRAAGWSVRGIFVFFVAATLMAACVGLQLQRAGAPEALSFVLLLATSGALMAAIRAMVKRARAVLIREEKHSVLADGIGDVPHVSDVEGFDRRHYVRGRSVFTTIENPNEPVRARFVTPQFGPPDVEAQSDIDVA